MYVVSYCFCLWHPCTLLMFAIRLASNDININNRNSVAYLASPSVQPPAGALHSIRIRYKVMDLTQRGYVVCEANHAM